MLFCVMFAKLDQVTPSFARFRQQWQGFFLSRPFAALLTKLFAFILAIFGILTVMVTVWIVLRTYSPVLFWDQWQVLGVLMESGGHPSLRQLWAQHNEHRLFVGRLLGFADLLFFRGRNVSLFAEILGLQLCHLLLFALVFRRWGRLPWPVYASLVGFLAYCLFSPLQMENFDWAFQVVFVLTSFAATACFASALWCYQQTAAGSRWRLLALTLCLLTAFIAEGSVAHGLLTWPVLILLAFALRFRPRDRWIIAAVASAAIAAYLIGYQSPAPPHALADALSRPLDLLKFILTYLGNSWDAHLPNESRWPVVSESVCLIAIIATLVYAVRCWRRRSSCSPLQIFLLGNLLFGLGTAGMTALGRLRFGIPLALASRYQTPALVFWGSLAALLAVTMDWSTPRRLLAGQTILLVLMLAAAGRWNQMAQIAAARQYQLEESWNAVVHDRFSDPAAARLFYSLDMLKGFVPYLRQRHWGPSGEITSFAKIQRTGESARLQGYRLLPSACLGQLEETHRSGLTSVFVKGWAYNRFDLQPAGRIALASGAGQVIGYADLSTVRPDVAAHYPGAQNLETGWQANISVPADGLYHAFLLFGDTHSACALQNELRIRNLPNSTFP